MVIIMGLGNPGKEYEGTRHNVGRDFAKKIAKQFDFSEFKNSVKYSGFAANGKIARAPAVIILPDTFMNKSGKALAAAKVKPKDLVVMHDDADLALGSAKISFGRNSAGHKGVESVMRAVKSKDFWRVRIGIQKKKRVAAEKIVLKKLLEPEKKILKKIEKRLAEEIERGLSVTTVSVL